MLISAFAFGTVGAQGPSQPVPVLAELFTSEGCNSCPPADRLLEMLSTEQPIAGAYVVALIEHVTYWDRLGWKDSFGSQRFTTRQNMYAFHFNLDGPFTPQVVVDGHTQMIGSDAAKLRSAIESAARRPKPPMTIAIGHVAEGRFTASVSGPGLRAAGAERAELVWVVAEDGLSVDVTRGENAHRTLRHWGVARIMIARQLKPNAMDGHSETIELRPEWRKSNLRIVAFVQASKSKRILSVASLPLGAGE